jgi:hypothetical protein
MRLAPSLSDVCLQAIPRKPHHDLCRTETYIQKTTFGFADDRCLHNRQGSKRLHHFFVTSISIAFSLHGKANMTDSDQQMIQQAAAKALTCLARALEKEASGSPRWLLLVEALEAVETIDAVTDVARDAFAPSPSFHPASPVMRSERLALTRSLLCRRELPERLQAA